MRIHILTLLLIALLCTVGSLTASAATDVVDDLKHEADEGNPEALYRLYLLYNRGYESITPDETEALRMLRLAAEAGHPEAQNQLGYRLYSGKGMPRDISEGLIWLENAAINGNPRAAGNLGYLLIYGDGIDHDYENAAFWLKRGADANEPTSQSMLGDLYRNGQGVMQDTAIADSLYNEAFDRGLIDAAYKLRDLNADKWDALPPDSLTEIALRFYTHGVPDIAIPLLNKAAESHYPHALALLGDAYTRGLGVDYNHAKALDCYAAAAACGDPSAMFFIAELLEILPDSLDTLSEDVASLFKNLPHDADSWFQRAKAAGVTDAQIANRKLLE